MKFMHSFNALMILIVIFSLITFSLAEEFPIFDDQSSLGSTTEYNKMLPFQKVQFISENFGIQISEAYLGNTVIEGNWISISGGTFSWGGADFSGGNVEIENGKLIAANNANVKDLNYQGAKVNGDFSLSGNTLTIHQGNLNLGSSTTGLDIVAGEESNIDVSGGNGYTGKIQSNNNYNLILKDQSLPVSGSLTIINGRIKEAEKVEIKEPTSDLFSEISSEPEVSMSSGTVSDGNVFTTEDFCLDSNCLLAPEGGVAQSVVGTENVAYSGKGEMSYTEAGLVERQFSTPDEVVVGDPEWLLGSETEITEFQNEQPIFTSEVSQDTTYFPFPQSGSNSCPPETSCLSYNDNGHLVVQSTGAEQTSVDFFFEENNFLDANLFPEDQSSIDLNLHDTTMDGQEIVQLQCNPNEVEVYPVSLLPDFLQTYVYGQSLPGTEIDYQSADGQTLQVTADGFTLFDEQSQVVGEVSNVFDSEGLFQAYQENGYSVSGDEIYPNAGNLDFLEMEVGQEYNRRLNDLYGSGEISSQTMHVLYNTPNLNLDDSEVRTKIQRLNQRDIDIKKINVLTTIYDKYGVGNNEQIDRSLLDNYVALSEGGNLNTENLNLPQSLSKEQLPEFLGAIENFRKLGVYRHARDEVETSLELWNTPEFKELGYSDESLRKYLENPNNKENLGKGKVMLQKLEALSKNPSLSPETRQIVRNILKDHGREVGVRLNELHTDQTNREQLAKTLTFDQVVGILAQGSWALGSNNGIYYSSEELVFNRLAELAGGESKIMSYLKSKGYSSDSPEMINVMRMLSETNQMKKVIPTNPSEKEDVLNSYFKMIQETPQTDYLRNLMDDKKTRAEVVPVMVQEYNKLKDSDNPQDKVKRNAIQFSLIEHKSDLDLSNPDIRAIVDNPSVMVSKELERRVIPSKQWYEQSKKEGDLPVIKGVAYFTSTEDKNELVHMNSLQGLEGFSVVKTNPDGYVLEKKGRMLVDGKNKPVLYRVVVTKDQNTFEKELGDASIAVERGHSYNRNKFLKPLEEQKKDKPIFVAVGSCSGAAGITGGGLPDKMSEAMFWGTSTTGMGNKNTHDLGKFFDSLDQCDSYDCADKIMNQDANTDKEKNYRLVTGTFKKESTS